MTFAPAPRARRLEEARRHVQVAGGPQVAAAGHPVHVLHDRVALADDSHGHPCGLACRVLDRLGTLPRGRPERARCCSCLHQAAW